MDTNPLGEAEVPPEPESMQHKMSILNLSPMKEMPPTPTPQPNIPSPGSTSEDLSVENMSDARRKNKLILVSPADSSSITPVVHANHL